ncbi:M56 family metallopeptidase [Ulvibacterium sp.]|uniref:M56 family metallopeptidase n=1 Tax=Ulvibacterium sp. TaxID=2665914 RepID=UPI003CC6CF4C
MLMYILKSSACLALFLIFYKIFLEREKMHVFKRFYLLISLVLALTIPTLTFTEYIETTTGSVEIPLGFNSDAQEASQTISSDLSAMNIPLFLWTIYLFGVLFFALRFAKNLSRVIGRIRSNPKFKRNQNIYVLLWEKIVPHTFFNFIFLSKSKYETHLIPKEVLLHEEAHAQQMHSLDILFIEVLQVILWFNPLFFFVKDAVRLNHEFLADQAVLNQGASSPSYQSILLAFTSPSNYENDQPWLANAINYSSIRLNVLGKKFEFISPYRQVKKRFAVMKKQTSKHIILLKSFLLLPLLAISLYSFSDKKVILTEITDLELSRIDSIQENITGDMIKEYNALAKKYNDVFVDERAVKSKDILRMEHIYHRMSQAQKNESEPLPKFADPLQESQEGATPEQVAQYNALAKKYNAMIETEENIFIKKSDVELLEYLHSLMTEEQKNTAEPFPDFPDAPEPPIPPAHEVAEIQEEVEKLAALMAEKVVEVRQQRSEMAEMEIEIEKQEAQMKEQAVALEKQHAMMEKESLELQEQAQKMEKQDKLMEKESLELERQARKLERSVPPPPPPPEPESPLEFVKKMKKKNAIFYHEGKKISADQALELLKNSNDISINSKGSKGKRPIVEISTGSSH